eukprot:gene13839-biopygen3550
MCIPVSLGEEQKAGVDRKMAASLSPGLAEGMRVRTVNGSTISSAADVSRNLVHAGDEKGERRGGGAPRPARRTPPPFLSIFPSRTARRGRRCTVRRTKCPETFVGKLDYSLISSISFARLERARAAARFATRRQNSMGISLKCGNKTSPLFQNARTRPGNCGKQPRLPPTLSVWSNMRPFGDLTYH